MALSIGVLLAGLGALAIGFGSLGGDPDPRRVQSDVEREQTVRSAQALTDYDVVVPVDLPDGWTTTTSRVDRGATGASVYFRALLGPDEQYVGLLVLAADEEQRVEQETEEADVVGTEEAGGLTWDVHAEQSDGDVAWTSVDDERTVVLVGGRSADAEDLRTVARSLEPAEEAGTT